MPKSFKKLIAVILIAGVNYVAIFSVGETAASFNDTEISKDNVYIVGTLDFSLSSPHDNFIPQPKAKNMEPGDKVKRMIKVRQEGSLPFKYTARTEKISGDDDFCRALELEAKLEGEIKYPSDGGNSLMDFNFSAATMVNPPGINTWQFEILLPADAPNNLQNKTCQFKFIFEGWQDNQENYEDGSFDDTEEIESELASVGLANQVTINYPIGGEVWHIGGSYDIEWTAHNNNGDDSDLIIDIYFSNDSGVTWANVVTGAENDGVYTWNNLPWFLYDENNDPYSLISNNSKIKIVATGYAGGIVLSDMSDDFCPPIDCSLLTLEKMDFLVELGILDGSECDFGDSDGNNVNGDNTDIGVIEIDGDTIDDSEPTPNPSQEGNNIGGSGSELPIEDDGDSAEENSENKTDDDCPEEFLTPKEQALPDDDFSDNEGGDGNNNKDDDEDNNEDEDENENVNNDSGENESKNGINKNSVDSIQAIN